MPNGTHTPEEILAAARRARERGIPLERVNATVARLTDNRFPGMASLENFLRAPDPEEAALARNVQFGPVQDFLRAAAQGATFGFADELAALGPRGLLAAATGQPVRAAAEAVSPEGQARLAASRERIEDIRQLNPGLLGAASLSEFAGAAGVPVGAAGQAVRGSVLRPAATGALAGGLFGVGEAEEDRVASGLIGAGLGAGGGAFLGAIGAGIPALARVIRLKLTPGRAGEELATRLAQHAETRGSTITSLLERSRGRVGEVRRQVFRPLEEQFRRVDDPLVLRVLRTGTVGDVARKHLPERVMEFVRTSGRSGRPPSFTELQAVRRALANEVTRSRATATFPGDPNRFQRFSAATDFFTEALDRRLPGYASARAQFANAKAAERAVNQALKLKRKPADVIRAAMDDLPTDEARENFRGALVADLYDQLASRGDVRREAVDKLMALGMRDRIRLMFRTEGSFNKFMQDLQSARRAAVAKEALVPVTMRLIQGLGLGGGGYVGYRIARGLVD